MTAPWPQDLPRFEDMPERNMEERQLMPVKYKYYIRRTKTGNLPVYNETGHGGSLRTTIIRLVEGDPRVSTPNAPHF